MKFWIFGSRRGSPARQDGLVAAGCHQEESEARNLDLPTADEDAGLTRIMDSIY